MYFDTRAAKALQPGEHMTVDGCPGLRLVATDTRKTWTYRYKAGRGADGRMKQVSLGQWPVVAPHAAASEWQRLREARGAGDDPGAKRRTEKQVLAGTTPAASAAYTVRNAVADYLALHLKAHRGPTALGQAQVALDKFLDDNPALADRAAASLTRAEAYDAIEQRKATPTMATKLRSMLGGAWELGLDRGKIVEAPNWWRDVHKGKLKSKGKVMGGKHVGRQRRVLQPDELALLLPWALANMHAHGRDVLVMYLWTCTRGVEITGMRPQHVSEEKGEWWWTVPKRLTKNARFHDAVDLRVPLIGRARDIVAARLERVGPSGWLFEGEKPGQPYQQKDFSVYIYNMQPYSPRVKNRVAEGDVLPVANWSPHDLRKTGRTLLASLGCVGEVAEAILGHMPSDIEATYNAYTYDAERRLWLGKLATHLEALIQPA